VTTLGCGCRQRDEGTEPVYGAGSSDDELGGVLCRSDVVRVKVVALQCADLCTMVRSVKCIIDLNTTSHRHEHIAVCCQMHERVPGRILTSSLTDQSANGSFFTKATLLLILMVISALQAPICTGV
jgi:hypothetical protein